MSEISLAILSSQIKIIPPDPDIEAPVITSFTIDETSDSLTVNVLTFTTTDNIAVTGYVITETDVEPSTGWVGSAPTTYTFSKDGTKTLYAWAKDAAGNISNYASDTTIITNLEYSEDYSGTIYYVANDGDDGDDGSKATPFASIDKVNTLVLSEDDAVLFESSGEYEGTITIEQSGTSGHPITIGAYGSTDFKPRISGSEIITGWTVHSGNIYKATFATNIQQLFVDGEKIQVARLTNTGYNLITSISSQTVFTIDAPSEVDNYYVGVTVIFRMQNYFSDTRVVTSSTGNTITVDSAPSSTIAANQSVLLMNKLEFLDTAGQWYYDSITDTVYLWTLNGDSPAGYEVRGSTLDTGILANNVGDYVTIKDIEFLHQKKAGVRIIGSTSIDYLTVDNCTFYGQDQYGIYSHTSDFNHGAFTNNRFEKINGVAILSLNTTAEEITGNTFTSIGLMEDWGISNIPYLTDYGYNNNGTAVEVSIGGATPISPNIIAYNDFYNIGYNGIYHKSETEIHNNYFNGIGLSKSDGGAIYTGSPLSDGSIITYNIIDYVLGNSLGGTLGRNYGFGIYLDENCLNNTVEYNTIIGASDAAIFLHKPNNHTVRYNKTIDSRYGVLTSNTSTGNSDITNNLIVTGSDTDDYEARQLLVKHTTNGVTFNNNEYINGFASDNVFNISGEIAFAAWQSAGHDAASEYDGTDLVGSETQRLVYNNTGTTKTFYLNNATGVKDKDGASITTSFTVAAFDSKYIRGINIDCVLDYSDAVAPTITDFTIPTSSATTIVDISTFVATGNPTAYLITQSATTPTLLDAGWSLTVPTTYSASGGGAITLYAWVRDEAGNISTSASDGTTIPDLTANLLANYRHDQTSGTVSPDLVGSADGTIYGTPTMDGDKITLDGVNDYISYPLPTVLSSNQYNSDFSLNIKFTVFATPGAAKRLFYQASSYTRGIQVVLNTNRDIYAIITENDVPATSGKLTSGGVAINTPHNLTITWDAATNTLKMYLDGTEITGTYGSNSLYDNSSGMRLGSSIAAHYINADVYELSVFDKKLDDAEVLAWINR